MVKKCKVLNCPVKARTKVGQFSFPVKRELCLKWIEACGLGHTFQPSVYSRVCEIHFKQEDFRSQDGKLRRRLKPGAIPSLNIGNGELTKEARQILDNQKKASLEALENAKRALQEQKDKEEQARAFRENVCQPDDIPSPMLSPSSVSKCRPTRKLTGYSIQPLGNNEGIRIEVNTPTSKAPIRIGHIFRDEAVKKFIEYLADESRKSSTTRKGKRESLKAFRFEIRPCRVEESEPSSELNLSKAFNEAMKFTSSKQSKRKKPPPPWFKEGEDPAITAAKMKQPPAVLSTLQPVPISRSLKVLFGNDSELPPAPEPLPPINARLIFVDKTQLESHKEKTFSETPIEAKSVDEGEARQSFVTLQVPLNLPPGPIAILDPDGLKMEAETWREKYVSLQRSKFNMDVKMNEARSERKRLLQKIKALTKARSRTEQVHQKRRLKNIESITKLKNEINELRRSKRSQELLLDGDGNSLNEFRVVMVDSDDPQENNSQSILIDTDKRFRNINDLYEAALTDGRSVVVAREKPGALRSVANSSSAETIYSIDESQYQTKEIIMSFDQSNQTWVKIEQN